MTRIGDVGVWCVLFALVAVAVIASFPSAAFSADENTPKMIVAATGGRVEDMKPVTKEEVLARFPMEKHKEFMARAIANSYKTGVEYKTGGAFGAVVVDRNGKVLADGAKMVKFIPMAEGFSAMDMTGKMKELK